MFRYYRWSICLFLLLALAGLVSSAGASERFHGPEGLLATATPTRLLARPTVA